MLPFYEADSLGAIVLVIVLLKLLALLALGLFLLYQLSPYALAAALWLTACAFSFPIFYRLSPGSR